MKTIKEMVTIHTSLLEQSAEIIEAIVSENKWEKTWIPRSLELTGEIRMAVVNTYEYLVYENTPKHIIRGALDGIVIPNIPNNHGGSRPGAGRPTTGRKQTKFFLNEEEKQLVKQYIDSIRK